MEAHARIRVRMGASHSCELATHQDISQRPAGVCQGGVATSCIQPRMYASRGRLKLATCRLDTTQTRRPAQTATNFLMLSCAPEICKTSRASASPMPPALLFDGFLGDSTIFKPGSAAEFCSWLMVCSADDSALLRKHRIDTTTYASWCASADSGSHSGGAQCGQVRQYSIVLTSRTPPWIGLAGGNSDTCSRGRGVHVRRTAALGPPHRVGGLTLHRDDGVLAALQMTTLNLTRCQRRYAEGGGSLAQSRRTPSSC